ncbi:hypothetical protein [Stappia indica]|uniref:hypothetical protein n=1 Tax=Stappia indica TaxID=538381 RepID=UPI001CD6CB3B|nr:hypothetical protein [Stappia indica]MCA1297422.1 hypothetical protein [Stappia indica]
MPLFAAQAPAEPWQSGVSNDGTIASAQTSAAGKILDTGCSSRLRAALYFTLTGGPHEGMRNVDDTSDSMMMWITLSGGRLARHPVDGHDVDAAKTFVGTLPATEPAMEEFSSGSRIAFTTAEGITIFSAPMEGATKARAAFRKACGI